MSFRAIKKLKFFGHNRRVGTGIKINRLQPDPVILLSVRQVKLIDRFFARLPSKIWWFQKPRRPNLHRFRGAGARLTKKRSIAFFCM